MLDINAEAALYGMFDPEGKMAPPQLMQVQHALKKEPVLCITRTDMGRILESPRLDMVKEIGGRIARRNTLELYGKYVQCIVAACIHNDKEFLTLRLNRDPLFVNGYHKGSITYPQGHVNVPTWKDRNLQQELWTGETPVLVMDGSELLNVLKENLIRELLEEICFDDETPNCSIERRAAVCDNLVKLVKGATCSDLYPINIDRAGSTRNHVCFLFDLDIDSLDLNSSRGGSIDMTAIQLAFKERHLISNESKKHHVWITDYEGLVEKLDGVDDICIWMQKSFSMLPFMQTYSFFPYKKEVNPLN